MYVMRGIGQTEQQVNQTVAAAGSVASAAGAAPIAAALSVGVPVAGAVIGAAIMGVTLAIDAIMNSGCGQTCIETSQWANAAEQQLRANLNAYFALPTPRSQSNQAAALANFDTIWSGLEARCGAQGTGNAGVRCITDRQAGACTWKQPASSVPPWGTPAAGECWNWWNGYRDPIANDPDVTDDATASTASSTALTGSSPVLELLLAAAAVFVLVKVL